jgi:type I restriction enzyme S subunit
MRSTTNRVPPLRFSAFKESWKRWLLDEFAVRGSGHTPSKSFPEYYGGGIDWISLADSNRLDNGYIEKTKTKITDLGLRHSSAVLHPAGTVILSRDAGIGKSAVMKHSMAVSQHFIVWRPVEQTSVDWFIYYWLQIMKPEFERIAIGSTIKTIGLPYFKKLEISAPSVTEQRKIADFLTAVDGRLAQLSQKKALLEAYKKGVMQQLFTQALRFKDDHGNDFPYWEEAEFGKIAKRSSEKHNPMTSASEYPSVELESLTQGTGQLIQLFTSTDQKSIKNKFTKGDVLFGKLRPYLRKWLMSTFDGVCSSEIWVLRGKAVTNEYLYQLIQTGEFMKATNVSSGSKMPRADWDHIAAVSFSYPASKAEQTKIANFLTALDRKIEALAAQIAHTQTWKKGLLQQMFV